MARRPDQFPIVTIGASAGGIEALNAFLGAVPAESGMAYVILLHMPLDLDSKITEVLGAHIEVPVKFAKTGVSIKPNTVYVAQPGFDLVIRDGSFIAQQRNESVHPQRPVDNLFESIAADVHECAIAVILSGTGTNGTAGVRAIKAEGGLVIAQDPASTRFPGMPRSAIASGFVDLVLAPAAMPRAIMDYARHPYITRKTDDDEINKDRESDRQFSSVLALIKTRSNHDFRGYKKRTLTRRVFRRMGLRRVDTIDDYLLILRNEPDELKALVGDLLISVTGFFRDPEAWQELDERVVTPLVQERDPDMPVRIWVPACATGEEAYTVAMLLLERCRGSQKNLDIKVFATDADTNALAKARAAVYPASSVAGMSQEQLTRFFDQQDDTYRVKKELRELVIFAPQDILADPPFSRLDLVTCRNLMIYLEAPLQKRILSLLHFALREGGYLFLGNAETISGNETLFRVVSKKWRIFRRVGPTRHDLVDFPVAGSIRSYSPDSTTGTPPNRMRQKATDQAQRVMVDEYAPPSVLIDEHCRVMYYHGDTEPYLRQPAGEPTNDLLTLVREGMRSKLRAGIQKVLKEGKRTRLTVRVRRQNGYVPVHVTVIPAQHDADQELRLLISFTEAATPSPAFSNTASTETAAESVITEHDIEEELRSVREELRSTIEQLESSNEEMKASNEEITSMNEELQSTNEELETSKEELQSLNEELNTVNAQLQSKVEELEDRTNDLNNLLNSSDIATLFLDIRFSIRWFTPAMRGLLDILRTDIGRPVSHFALKFEDPAFLKDAELVLQNLIPRESEVKNEEGRWYMRRILPYRTEDNRIDGVVVTFTEITERRRWEEDIRQARDFAERIVDTLQDSLVVLDPSLRVKTANRAFFETFKLPRTDVEGRLMFDLGRGDWDIPDLRRILSPVELAKARSLHHNATIEHQFRELGKRMLSVNIRLLDDGMILLVIKDVSDVQDFQRRQDVLLAELQHRVKNILASVQAIARMTHQRSTSLDEFWDSFQGRLMALATTQELLTRARVDRVGLNELVVQELTAQGARTENYQVDGPPLNLTAKAAQNLALALHELTTNATKHGALTQPEGRIEVKWDVNDGQIRFEWIESGGPSVTKPSRRGFGTELIEKAIPYQLRGRTKLDYQPDGLHCTFEFGTPGNIVSPDNLSVFSPPARDDKPD